MSPTPAYPGVYVEEVSSSAHAITGAPTSIAAFIGYTPRGIDHRPQAVFSFADYERLYGGLAANSEAGYAVRQFFLNGGTHAYVVRTPMRYAADDAVRYSRIRVGDAGNYLTFTALSSGTWTNGNLQVDIDMQDVDLSSDTGDPLAFNVSISDRASGTQERFAAVTLDSSAPNSVVSVVNDPKRGSALMSVEANLPAVPTALTTGNTVGAAIQFTAAAGPAGLPGTAELIGDPLLFTGLHALAGIDLFNLLSIPDATRSLPGDSSALDTTVDPTAIYKEAAALCVRQRAMLLVDPPPNVNSVSSAVAWNHSLGLTDPNAAAFFPRLRLADPLDSNRPRTFAPSGVVAGVCARIDATRGVWKAPSGTEASLRGVQGMTCNLTDAENGVLNALAVNCCRTFPGMGPVLWGARTLQGADTLVSQWKYVPVRRLALYIEESIDQGTQCVVFEPNGESLWASIRLSVGAFLQSLFKQGAFQGGTPAQSYFVKCDRTTMTQTDVDEGFVNIAVGFAPLKPGEFITLRVRQATGSAAD